MTPTAGSARPVSTGVKGRETPAGVFAVIEKDKDHHSTMYDDAWMPNMQRITWNGLALHGGPLPGYAASHGCIRMPYGFAEEMFDKTRIGMRVIISPNDAEPVEFSHPALLQPNADAIAAAPARAEALAGEATQAAETADEAKKAAAIAAQETKSLAASVRRLGQLKTRADAQLASADKALLSTRPGPAPDPTTNAPRAAYTTPPCPPPPPHRTTPAHAHHQPTPHCQPPPLPPPPTRRSRPQRQANARARTQQNGRRQGR